MSTPSVEVVASPKSYTPGPLISDVTSHSTQLFAAIAPLSSTGPLVNAGRVAHVTWDSVQASAAP